MRNVKGLSFIELLIALTLITILFFPMIDLLNNGFKAEYENRLNVQAREDQNNAITRITSTIKEASTFVDYSITIPAPKGSAVITPGANTVVALVPVSDSDTGELSRSSGQTEFKAYAYTLMPEADYFADSTSDKYVMVEAYNTFYCATSSDNEYVPSSECNTDWSGTGKSNMLFKGAEPGLFYDDDAMTTFNTDNNQLELTLGAKEGTVYFPASTGDAIDEKFIESVNIYCRNIHQ